MTMMQCFSLTTTTLVSVLLLPIYLGRPRYSRTAAVRAWGVETCLFKVYLTSWFFIADMY